MTDDAVTATEVGYVRVAADQGTASRRSRHVKRQEALVDRILAVILLVAGHRPSLALSDVLESMLERIDNSCHNSTSLDPADCGWCTGQLSCGPKETQSNAQSEQESLRFWERLCVSAV